MHNLLIKIKKNYKKIKQEAIKKMPFKRNKPKTGYKLTVAETIIIALLVMIISIGATTAVIFYTGVFKDDNKLIIKDSELERFYEVYQTIKESYIDNISSTDLINGAISGLLSATGDKNTSFFDEERTDSFNEIMAGEYYGIGAQLSRNDQGQVYISGVFENSPAVNYKLQVNDVIVSVDGVSMVDKTTEDVANAIKKSGKAETVLVISRDGVEKTYNMIKAKVSLPSVTNKTFIKGGKKVGYIKIENFANNTYTQFKNNLETLEKQNIDSLIIDVRSNTGGYLESVTKILNMFFAKGTIIYQVSNNQVTIKTEDTTFEKRGYEVAVLTNGNTASASEILAAAFNENSSSIIVGTNTFGKGTVQTVKELSDGSMVKYTIQKWLTPNGNWINAKGITPTFVVEPSQEYLKNPTDANDNQLQKALEEIVK